MGIDWMSNCTLGNDSFLPCELQFLINQYTELIYGIGFIVIVLVVTIIVFAVLRTKKRKMLTNDEKL